MIIHIQIKTAGTDLPTMEETQTRYDLEDAITDKGLGEIVDSGGGDGNMDIFVEIGDRDKDATMAEIEKIAQEQKVARFTVSVEKSGS